MALLAITRRARVRRGEEPARAAAGEAPAVLIGVIKGTITTPPPPGTAETRTNTDPPHSSACLSSSTAGLHDDGMQSQT